MYVPQHKTKAQIHRAISIMLNSSSSGKKKNIGWRYYQISLVPTPAAARIPDKLARNKSRTEP